MLKNQKGFSLIELMVVVAIIGILAAIAIPNFQKFQEKARQSEAKTNLGGIFTAETAFFTEYSAYFGEWDSIGYAPLGVMGYTIGFAGPGALPPGAPVSASAACYQNCSALNTTVATAANCGAAIAAQAWTCANLNGKYAAPAGATTPAATFVASAGAVLNPNSLTVFDTWNINQSNDLTNLTNGL